MPQNFYSKVQTQNANLELAKSKYKTANFTNFNEFLKIGKIHEFSRTFKTVGHEFSIYATEVISMGAVSLLLRSRRPVRWCWLVDLDMCSSHGPCRHGATCHNDGHGGYSCSCRDGFAGTNCERDLRDCRHRQLACLHNATCQVRVSAWICITHSHGSARVL